MPLLEAFAVKDEDSGRPCVTFIGPRGAGHYVKMAHNGIEQGMMGALAESWELMFKCLHMKLNDIADVYEAWTGGVNSELVCSVALIPEQDRKLIHLQRKTFLVEIAVDVCRQPDPSGRAPHLLNRVQDKVVQDADDT
jgi:6-phosphogluconate dehydrogenase